MEAVIGDYYTPGPEVPAVRIPQPRTAARNTCRETGRLGFPWGSYTYRMLGRDLSKVPSNYVFLYKHNKKGVADFTVIQNEGSDEWGSQLTTTDAEVDILKTAIRTGTPVLGALLLVVRMKKRLAGHAITYLMRKDTTNPNRIEFIMFETYSVTKWLMKGDDSWLKAVKGWVNWVVTSADPKLTYDVQSIVPSDIDFQEQDPGGGRCMTWSFVFLSFLKDLDLRNATRADFDALYTKMNATLAEKDGYDRLLSQFYGARRRKTRRMKFLRRGHNEQSILAASNRSRRRTSRT